MLRKPSQAVLLSAALIVLQISQSRGETEFPAQDSEIQDAINQTKISGAPDRCTYTTTPRVNGQALTLIHLIQPFNVSSDGKLYSSFPECAKYWNQLFDSLFQKQLEQRVPLSQRFRSIHESAQETSKRLNFMASAEGFGELAYREAPFDKPGLQSLEETRKLFTNTLAPYLGLREDLDPDTDLPGLHPVELAKYMGLSGWLPSAAETIAPKNERDWRDWTASALLIDPYPQMLFAIDPVIQVRHPVRYWHRAQNRLQLNMRMGKFPALRQISADPFVAHVRKVSGNFMLADEGVDSATFYAETIATYMMFNFLGSLEIFQAPARFVETFTSARWVKVGAQVFVIALPVDELRYLLDGRLKRDLNHPPSAATIAILSSQAGLVAGVAFNSGLFGIVNVKTVPWLLKSSGLTKNALPLPKTITDIMKGGAPAAANAR